MKNPNAGSGSDPYELPFGVDAFSSWSQEAAEASTYAPNADAVNHLMYGVVEPHLPAEDTIKGYKAAECSGAPASAPFADAINHLQYNARSANEERPRNNENNEAYDDLCVALGRFPLTSGAVDMAQGQLHILRTHNFDAHGTRHTRTMLSTTTGRPETDLAIQVFSTDSIDHPPADKITIRSAKNDILLHRRPHEGWEATGADNKALDPKLLETLGELLRESSSKLRAAQEQLLADLNALINDSMCVFTDFGESEPMKLQATGVVDHVRYAAELGNLTNPADPAPNVHPVFYMSRVDPANPNGNQARHFDNPRQPGCEVWLIHDEHVLRVTSWAGDDAATCTRLVLQYNVEGSKLAVTSFKTVESLQNQGISVLQQSTINEVRTLSRIVGQLSFRSKPEQLLNWARRLRHH